MRSLLSYAHTHLQVVSVGLQVVNLRDSLSVFFLKLLQLSIDRIAFLIVRPALDELVLTLHLLQLLTHHPLLLLGNPALSQDSFDLPLGIEEFFLSGLLAVGHHSLQRFHLLLELSLILPFSHLRVSLLILQLPD